MYKEKLRKCESNLYMISFKVIYGSSCGQNLDALLLLVLIFFLSYPDSESKTAIFVMQWFVHNQVSCI